MSLNFCMLTAASRDGDVALNPVAGVVGEVTLKRPTAVWAKIPTEGRASCLAS